MAESRHPDWEPITAYVADMSYFSGKMEAYLRYKEIPYERRVVTSGVMRDEVLPATGLMKVPVIRLADGRWLKDTTPMIDWFEAKYHQIACLKRVDPETAKKVSKQFRFLYPDLGGAEWRPKFEKVL